MRYSNILTSVVLAGVLLSTTAIFPQNVAIAADRTFVAGKITDGNNHAVLGANVTISCIRVKTKTNKTTTITTTKSATSNAGGDYQVKFNETKCDDGDQVYVTASKGGQNGSNSGEVNNYSAHINLAIVNVAMVPEFGLPAGAVALFTSAGSFLAFRRKKIH